MVTSALSLNEKCCFDFGNAEINDLDNKAGHMDAINIMCHGNPCSPDAGLDMEDGIYGHLKVPAGTTFVTDMGASDGQHKYAIYQGNAQSGALTTTGIIPLPNGYQPMKQEGAIILGIGKLSRLLPEASKKILMTELRQLVSSGLVEHRDLSDGGMVRHVEYNLIEPIRPATFLILEQLEHWALVWESANADSKKD